MRRPICAQEEGAANSLAIVVFVNETDLGPLKILRPGFRHCFVLVRAPQCWIVCDPLAHQLDLIAIEELSSETIAEHFRQRGHTVVVTRVLRAPRRLTFLRPLTCVETVKRVLGIHAAFVVTPWQLFRFLEHRGDNTDLSTDQTNSVPDRNK